MRAKVDDPDTVCRDLDLADARVRITDAIERAAMTIPAFETDTWPVCRPIVEWVTRQLPEGGTGYVRPEWSEDDHRSWPTASSHHRTERRSTTPTTAGCASR